MVNAAVEFKYGKDRYKVGDKLPNELAKHLEIYAPCLLDSYIEINAIWQRIDNPNLKGFIQKNKNRDGRLRRYFKVKDVKPKEEEPEAMLKVKEKPKEIPKPKPKYTGITFKALKRKQQENILTKLGISFSKKDKERDLIRKYLKNV